MEQDGEALKVLKANIAQTDPSMCEVYSGNTFANIASVVKMLQRKGEDAYFYIDPPFSIREGMEDIYDKTIALIASFQKNASNSSS